MMMAGDKFVNEVTGSGEGRRGLHNVWEKKRTECVFHCPPYVCMDNPSYQND